MQELLKKYQAQLRLSDWDIELIEDESISNDAETLLIFNDYKAVVKINKKHAEKVKEESLIHELLHLIFRDAYDLFEANVSDEAIKTYTQRQHERAIEKTAKIIYKLNHGE
jgi:hypothetical protein